MVTDTLINRKVFTKFCNPELYFSSFSVNVQQLILTDPSFSTDTSENKLKNGFRSLIKASNQISLFVRQIRGVLRRCEESPLFDISNKITI